MEHVSDHPWPGWQVELFGVEVTLMSSGIASMVLTAVVLMAVVIPWARRWRRIPHGGANVLEVVVMFVRDMIARPTLGEKAYDFLPFLLTLFLYVLGMNLMGIVPLQSITLALGLEAFPLGATATSIPVVCAALAGLTFLSVVFLGLRKQAITHRRRTGRSVVLCAAVAPALWFRSLSPEVPGAIGKILAFPIALIELVGAVAKCFSLMIRLFANIVSGHALLAILMLFFMEALALAVAGHAYDVGYITPVIIFGSVVVNLLELLVAGLQAYIFTFLTAMFLALYVEQQH